MRAVFWDRSFPCFGVAPRCHSEALTDELTPERLAGASPSALAAIAAATARLSPPGWGRGIEGLALERRKTGVANVRRRVLGRIEASASVLGRYSSTWEWCLHRSKLKIVS